MKNFLVRSPRGRIMLMAMFLALLPMISVVNRTLKSVFPVVAISVLAFTFLFLFFIITQIHSDQQKRQVAFALKQAPTLFFEERSVWWLVLAAMFLSIILTSFMIGVIAVSSDYLFIIANVTGFMILAFMMIKIFAPKLYLHNYHATKSTELKQKNSFFEALFIFTLIAIISWALHLIFWSGNKTFNSYAISMLIAVGLFYAFLFISNLFILKWIVRYMAAEDYLKAQRFIKFILIFRSTGMVSEWVRIIQVDLLRLTGKMDEAEELLIGLKTKLTVKQPLLYGSLLNAHAYIYNDRQDYQASIEMLENAYHLPQIGVNITDTLAATYMMVDEAEHALKLFDEAISNSQKHKSILAVLESGKLWALAYLGLHDEFQALLESHAVHVSQMSSKVSYSEYYFRLGKAFVCLDDIKQAKSAFQKSIGSYPNGMFGNWSRRAISDLEMSQSEISVKNAINNPAL